MVQTIPGNKNKFILINSDFPFLITFSLLQNLLLYYDSENSGKPIGVIFLEGCFCERVLNPVTGNAVGSGGNAGNNKSEKLHCTTDKMVRCFLNMVLMYLIPI